MWHLIYKIIAKRYKHSFAWWIVEVIIWTNVDYLEVKHKGQVSEQCKYDNTNRKFNNIFLNFSAAKFLQFVYALVCQKNIQDMKSHL